LVRSILDLQLKIWIGILHTIHNQSFHHDYISRILFVDNVMLVSA